MIPTPTAGGRQTTAATIIAKVVTQLVLVLATRQAIYRTFGDPLWSWLPFLAGGMEAPL